MQKLIFGYGLKNFRCKNTFQVRQTFDKIIQKVETVILTNHFTKMCIIYDRKYCLILNRRFIDYIKYLFYYKIISSINTIKILLSML